MTETLRWGLPLLAAGQAQKEITHNEALLAIDRMLHLAVISRRLVEPPASPAPGDIHIVAPPAQGEWAGKAGKLAAFDGFGWSFAAPREGSLAWVCDEGRFLVFHLGDWKAVGWAEVAVAASDPAVIAGRTAMLTDPSGGATIDIECRAILIALLTDLRGRGLAV